MLKKVVMKSVFLTCLLLIGIGAALTIILFVEVVCRYVFNSSLVITEELSRFLLIWMGFLGASVALYEKAHVGVDLIKSRLPEKAASVVHFVITALMLVFCVITLIGGIQLLPKQYTQIYPTMRISITWCYLSIPVSMVLMILQLIYSLICQMRGRQEELKPVAEMFGRKEASS